MANVFSAEIEFETVLNKDYSLKEIVLNVYREHSGHRQRSRRITGMTLYCGTGKEITGIRKTTDAEKLYTCIQPDRGKDGLTIQWTGQKRIR
ncbi:hypothetical protein [Mediterraneibacter gnavus]|uniref:hypothetical protein n=1 Tax=Mediterraneibacter gnavus TaxID=33038 RepID=UPI000467CE29|nr:hypothetical protein [Mediterraneibacter gnavus]